MTPTHSRRALAAGAAGFAAIGAAGAYVVMNAVGGNPVVNFTPAAATDDAQTTVSSLLDGVTNAAAGDTTTTTAVPNPADPAAGEPAPGAPPKDPAHCHHDGDHQPLDDVSAAKVKAAAEKAVTDATVEHTDHDRSNPDGYVAMMEKADGTHVLVHEDVNFNVTKVEDPAPPRPARGPGGPGHGRGDRPDAPPTTAANA